jgi:predicted nucleic acid-binding protein
LSRLDESGILVIIPAIADYEVRRGLLKKGAPAKLRNLGALRTRLAFVGISTPALEKAAEFWASLQRSGRPTADKKALDGDAILAGIAATIGGDDDQVIIATENLRHLNRFPGVEAQPWESII